MPPSGRVVIVATTAAVAFLAVIVGAVDRAKPESVQRVPGIPGPAWPTNKEKIRTALPPEEFDQPHIWRSPVQTNVTAQGGPVVFGPYVSVQVNVDGLGNNIPGDAANEPSMAIDRMSQNRIAIGWRQFDTIASNFRQAGVAYSTDGGQSFTFSDVLEPGRFRSDPVLGSDAAGNFYYSSLSHQLDNPNIFEVMVYKSSDGGSTWPQASYAFGGDKQWMVVDGRSSGTGAGYIAQFWNVNWSCCPPTDFTRSIDSGVSFESPIAIPQPSMKWGTMDVGPTGTLYLVGTYLDENGHLFSRSGNASSPAVTPTFDFVNTINLGGLTGSFGGYAGPNPVGLLGQVWLAAHPTMAGHLYVLGSVAPPTSDPMDVMFIRSTDDGQTWSTPVRVNDDASLTNAWQWFGSMSVAPNGRIDVTFNDTRLSGQANICAVFYTYSFDEGQTWAPNMQVTPQFDSHVGFPQQDKIGDYYHMVSDDGGANLAYAATFNGEEDVYFLRLTRDCNGNTLDDDCDVACGPPGGRCDLPSCGQSQDCNGNAVPDDCEPGEDCNGNMQVDICEIGADPGLDCNLNLILDECESPGDCNSNGENDLCDIANGAPDCNDNNAPDACDIDDGTSMDRDGNGVPDECLGACCSCSGCQALTSAACGVGEGNFGGFGTICADIGVCKNAIPENDLCANAMVLPFETSIVVDFDNRCAGSDGQASVGCHTPQPFGTDLWYQYTAPCTGEVLVSMCGSSLDAILLVHSSCVCPDPNEQHAFKCNDDGCVSFGAPRLTLDVVAGRCYLIRAGGWDGAVGTGTLYLDYMTQCTASPVFPEPNGVDKNRFISFTLLPSFLAGTQHALRVRLTSLHHPAEPPNAPDFSAFEGQYQYVNSYSVGPTPVTTCEDSFARGTSFRCARLGCAPEYRDWATDLGGAVLHVSGSAVVPSSTLDVSVLPLSCIGQEETCPDASAALQVRTGQWGDVRPGQLDVLDLSEMVDKVKEVLGALTEPRGLLHPQEPQPRTEAVNVLDISDVVSTLKDYAYPYAIEPCP